MQALRPSVWGLLGSAGPTSRRHAQTSDPTRPRSVSFVGATMSRWTSLTSRTKGIDMRTLRKNTWLHLAAGLACFAAIGCGAPNSSVTPQDPSDDPATDGGTADDAGNAATPDATNGAAPAAATGPKAPDFTLKTLDGGEITLSDLIGKVVLVDFWSTTCDPCLAEMPELVKLYNARKDKGFELLAVTIDGPETVAKVPSTVRKNKMTFPILLDEDTEAMDRYNPKGELPFTAVINKQGRIVMKRAGYQPGDESSWQKLVDAVDDALAAK